MVDLNKIVRCYYQIKEMPNSKFGDVLEAVNFMNLLGGNSYSKILIYSNGNKIKKTFYE
jgi:hypothetical protein